MKLIELALLYVLLMLFVSLCINVNFYIHEYRKETIMYLEKTGDVLKAHSLMLKNEEDYYGL